MGNKEIVNDYNLHKTLIERFIKRWRCEESIEQLYSETLNYLNGCLKDVVLAQQIKDGVTEGPCVIVGQASPPTHHATMSQREKICKLLEQKLKSITEQYVENMNCPTRII